MQALLSLEGLVGMALRGGAVLMVALVLGRLFGTMSAGRRYGLWVAAMAGMLMLPLLMSWAPGWRVLPNFRMESTVAREETQEMGGMTKEPVLRLIPNEGGQAHGVVLFDAIDVAPALSKSWGADWRRLGKGLTLIWLVGSLVGAMGLVLNVWRLRRLGNGVGVVESSVIKQVADELKLGRLPRLVLGAEDAVPMVWGVWQPKLLLPVGFELWTPEKLRAVLLHELAHLARRDPMALWVGQMARVVHWFNPLAWLTLGRLRADQEKACDDVVLRHGVRASDYAQVLLDLSRHKRPSAGLSMCALAMARLGPVEDRVLAVFDLNRSRAGAGRAWWSMWGVLGLGLVLPLAVVDAVEEPNKTEVAKNELGQPPPATGLVPGVHSFNQKKPFNGRDYVALEDVAARYGLKPWKREGNQLVSGEIMECSIGSQVCQILGIRHVLSYAVIEDSESAYLSQVDLATMIDPILRTDSTGVGLDFDTVVIDPGHGGHDAGGRGVIGFEKEMALELSQRLRVELETRGLKVVMTRENDVFVSQSDRVKVANDTPRSLLISIHLNSGGTFGEGIETFSISPSVGGDVKLREQGLLLARAVHGAVLAGTGLKDRGVKRARWTVLAGSQRPGLLFEAGFITHENDAKWIKEEANQQLMVERIATAILGLRTTSAKGKVAPRKGASIDGERPLNPMEKRPQLDVVMRKWRGKIVEEYVLPAQLVDA